MPSRHPNLGINPPIRLHRRIFLIALSTSLESSTTRIPRPISVASGANAARTSATVCSVKAESEWGETLATDR